MVDEVVSVETPKYPPHFKPPFFGQVHAPVNVFVGAVIAPEYYVGGSRNPPVVQLNTKPNGGDGSDGSEENRIPPRHGNGPFIFLIFEMITSISLKDMMMYFCVRVVSVIKSEEGSMHHKAMQPPFYEGRKNYIPDNPKRDYPEHIFRK